MATKAAEKKSSNSKPIIGIAIGCFVFLLLIGIGISFAVKYFAQKIGSSVVSGVIESKTGIKTNLSDIDNGKMTFTDNKTGQTVTVGTQKLPEDFPKDFPVYSDAKVAGSVSGMQESNSGFLVTFTTSDSIEKVISFYKNALAANGYTTSASFNTDKMQTWAVKKGSMEGSVSITADDSQTTILVTLGSKSE